MKFQCDPFLAALLRAVPIDTATDLSPPDGSIEAGAITHVYFQSKENVNETCSCGELKYSGLSAPQRVPIDDEEEPSDTRSVLCPRCSLSLVVTPTSEAAVTVAAAPASSCERAAIAGYCQFAFVRTTSGCRIEAYLVSVVVAKQHRGKGICKSLLAAALRDLAKSTPTLQRVKLHTNSEMKKLIAMYRDIFGFAVRRTIKNYYRLPRIADAVEMEMPVTWVEKFRSMTSARRREREEDDAS